MRLSSFHSTSASFYIYYISRCFLAEKEQSPDDLSSSLPSSLTTLLSLLALPTQILHAPTQRRWKNSDDLSHPVRRWRSSSSSDLLSSFLPSSSSSFCMLMRFLPCFFPLILMSSFLVLTRLPTSDFTYSFVSLFSNYYHRLVVFPLSKKRGR